MRRPGAGRACALTLAACALAATAPRAETPEQLFERANGAYEQGRYEEAAEGYRDLLRYRIEDPIVEYNLGNAEFKRGRIGAAILHYERARRLDPTDRDITGNLEHARQFIVDRVDLPEVPPLVRWVRSVQDAVGPDGQAWTALALGWCAAAFVAWCSARPGGWRASGGWLLAVLLAANATAWGSWYATWSRLEGQPLAVVQRAAVDVLAGPGMNNATLFRVHEGLTLVVSAEREEWLRVSLPNGLNGWVPRQAIEIV